MLANRARAAEIMEREGLSALVASTPENFLYTTDMSAKLTNWTVQAWAVLPKDPNARPAMIVPIIRLGVIAQYGIPEAEIYAHGEFYMEGDLEGKPSTEDIDTFFEILDSAKTFDDPVTALLAALDDRGLKGSTIGVDEMRMAPHLLDEVRDKLGSSNVVPGYPLFREIRLVKTPEEIRRLRRIAEINEQAEWEISELIEAGVHEQTLADHFRLSVTKQGALPTNVTIGAGPRSAIPTIEQYPYQMKDGDLIRYDLGSVLDGYNADTGRTVIIGKPTAEHDKHFNALLAGWELLIEMAKPGVKASDLFNAGMETIKSKGIPHYRRQHLGHAIGIELYDDFIIGPNDHRPLEENMVICIETPYYELGFGGFQIEDTGVVTNDGFDFMTHLERKIFER